MSMITISVNPAYPTFQNLSEEALNKVSVSLGPRGMNTMFFSYQAYPLNFATVGDAAINQASLMVSYRRPLVFLTRESFAIFGNVNVTDYSSSRLANLLADYVSKGALIVTDDSSDTPLTPSEILTFTP